MNSNDFSLIIPRGEIGEVEERRLNERTLASGT